MHEERSKPAVHRMLAGCSELEVDELIGVSVAQFDQQRNRDQPERRGDANRARPLVDPASHDVLARRQREGAERRHDNRRRECTVRSRSGRMASP